MIVDSGCLIESISSYFWQNLHKNPIDFHFIKLCFHFFVHKFIVSLVFTLPSPMTQNMSFIYFHHIIFDINSTCCQVTFPVWVLWPQHQIRFLCVQSTILLGFIANVTIFYLEWRSQGLFFLIKRELYCFVQKKREMSPITKELRNIEYTEFQRIETQ